MHILLDRPRDTSQTKIHGTITFRLSSTKVLDTWGGNRQNIEDSMRALYPADTGYTMIQVDQSGAEALIVSRLAPRGQYRDLFDCGIKPHTYVALHDFPDVWRNKFDRNVVEDALVAKVKELSAVPRWNELSSLIASSDDWPDNERYYYLGKKIVHASSYGMGVKTFIMAILKETAGRVVLKRPLAEKLLEAFHALFPEIRAWQFAVQRELKANKCLRNLFGYPRLFTEYIGEGMYEEAYSFVPQSTVGVLTSIAFTNFQNYIEDNNLNWHMLANTHDSYLYEVPDAEVEHGVKLGKQFMEMELTAPNGEKFRMKAEASAGKNWGHYKDTNPNGLKKVK